MAEGDTVSQYVFRSSLSSKEIRIRLYVYAKEAKGFGWSYSTGGFYYRFFNDDGFFLIRTRDTKLGATVKNQRVFNGTLISEENGTRIEGDFGAMKKNKPMYWFVAVVSVFSLMATRSILPLLLIIPFYLFMPQLLLNVVSPLYEKEEKAVISFIEEHLLR